MMFWTRAPITRQMRIAEDPRRRGRVSNTSDEYSLCRVVLRLVKCRSDPSGVQKGSSSDDSTSRVALTERATSGVRTPRRSGSVHSRNLNPVGTSCSTFTGSSQNNSQNLVPHVLSLPWS